jgi:peptide deformylase
VNGGIGLAAPQIGIFKRVFLAEETPKVFRAYINPSFVPVEGSAKAVGQEACLSVPGKVLRVARFVDIIARWTEITEDGTQLACEQLLSGLPAKVFQHELDHLDGISILEKSRQVRP